MLTLVTPSMSIGCSYCRAIEDIVLAWDYLYSQMKLIDSINNCTDFNDFENNHPHIANNFKTKFADSDVRYERLFLEVQFLAQKSISYGVNILINKTNGNYNIYNGRHRIQMAQILNIAIPVRLIIKY